jgi:flagellar motor protein MotB
MRRIGELNERRRTPDSHQAHQEGRGGHHGGAWKIAYADFVTAMMAFLPADVAAGLDGQR